jgi:hypothetical protein
MSKSYPTAEKLREHFAYDPETGIFTRRIGLRPGFPAGSIAGGMVSYGYWAISLNRVRYLAHRAAFLYMTGTLPAHDIDHINGDRLDNRWSNLRAVTRGVNLQNKRRAFKNNRTGLLGVHQIKSGKFRARVNLDGKVYEAGLHSTPEGAHQAYLQAKRTLHPGCTI